MRSGAGWPACPRRDDDVPLPPSRSALRCPGKPDTTCQRAYERKPGLKNKTRPTLYGVPLHGPEPEARSQKPRARSLNLLAPDDQFHARISASRAYAQPHKERREAAPVDSVDVRRSLT